MRPSFVLLAAIAVTLLVAVSARYYLYATNTKTPFDEVGIELHQNMPAAVQNWGCKQLKASFGGKTLPPPGCSGPGPAVWR